MAKKKAKLTKKQLDTLYECWKDGENTKERLALIEERLPKVSPLAALSVMRSMAKTDTKWLKMATRKKNLKEKEKLERRKAREKKKAEVEKKKIEREKKRKEKKAKEAQKKKLNKIKDTFKIVHLPKLEESVESEYIFCPAVHQYVHNISCIFRIFSNEFDVSLDSECDKCSRMDKYIPIIEEVLKDGRQKKTRGSTTSKSGNKSKKKDTKASTKGTRRGKNNN